MTGGAKTQALAYAQQLPTCGGEKIRPTITTASENTFVFINLLSNKKASAGYIGLADSVQEGTFQWGPSRTGTAHSFETADILDCALLNVKYSDGTLGTWADVFCDRTFPTDDAVVEYDCPKA